MSHPKWITKASCTIDVLLQKPLALVANPIHSILSSYSCVHWNQKQGHHGYQCVLFFFGKKKTDKLDDHHISNGMDTPMLNAVF